MPFFAHTRPDCEKSDWHELLDHLESTAELAEGFASYFAPGWGRIAGLWHDLGKYQQAFQKKLEVSSSGGYEDKSGGSTGRVEHAIVGAYLAHQLMGKDAKEAANCIASHHGGLKDASWLKRRFESGEIDAMLAECRLNIESNRIIPDQLPDRPDWVQANSIHAAMWTRFLFSALTDADSLQTQAWSASRERNKIDVPLSELEERLARYLSKFERKDNFSAVYKMRQMVLKSCVNAAELEPGAFTLTVPTGGGKTLSGLAFALKHCVKFGLQRVIVVLPYTTILEQTVSEYEKAIGADVVVEHHSNVDVEQESLLNREATENWDAPIVVTTSVQFLESLYSDRKSRCRKLHNISQSVVILDEVQTFPLDLIVPIKSALGLLVERFGTSVVYSTATQPMLAHGQNVREIIPNPSELFESVKGRFETIWRIGSAKSKEAGWDMQRLSEELLQETGSVLTVVHQRSEAAELAKLWGENVIHLSARMAPLHRSDVVAKIKEKLSENQLVRVAATQLVEAGVDFDFPTVYRAMAGLDSLAQAAGRCNRSGKLEAGRFVVFPAASKPPDKRLQSSMELAMEFVQFGKSDLSEPNLYREFFASLISEAVLSKKELMSLERELDFPEVARLFQMIEDHGESVVAPYPSLEETDPKKRPKWKVLLDELQFAGPSQKLLRRLQRFTVTLYKHDIRELLEAGLIEKAHPALEKLWKVLPGAEKLAYNETLGFVSSPKLGQGIVVS